MKIAGAVIIGLFSIVLGVALLTGLWAVGTYNSLVGKNEAVGNAWAQVQNVYQRRFDLIPNLVETVKGAAAFEKSTLTAVTQARASVGQFTVDKSILNNPAQFAKFQESQGILGSALNRLMVVMEKYPELKATDHFRDLQTQLEGTENRIAVERRTYNEVVQEFNRSIKVFPGNFVARFGNFNEKPYFKADEPAQKAVQVKF